MCSAATPEKNGLAILSKKRDLQSLSKNDAARRLYETMKIQEYQAEMNAEKYHLELQRLAGKKVVDNLSLYKFNYDSALFKGKKVAR